MSKQYGRPTVIEFGAVAALTGSCKDGNCQDASSGYWKTNGSSSLGESDGCTSCS